jgi:hypothetical protein
LNSDSLGYAREVNEDHSNICSLAAPVRNHNGEVIAAVGFSVPADRFGDREEPMRGALMQACAGISSRIGYHLDLSGQGTLVWASVGGGRSFTPLPGTLGGCGKLSG